MHKKLYIFLITALILWGCGNDGENSTTQPSTQSDNSDTPSTIQDNSLNNADQTNQVTNCTEGQVLFLGNSSNDILLCSKGQWAIGNLKMVDMNLCDYGQVLFNGQSWQICMGSWYELQEPVVNCPLGATSTYVFNEEIDPYKIFSNSYYTCIGSSWIRTDEAITYFPNKDFLLNQSFNYGTMTDPRDGKTYRTTTIGSQVWMAENLAYEPSDSINISYPNHSICYSCDIVGRHYKWGAAMGFSYDADYKAYYYYRIMSPHQGICPEGWHIPSEEEFQALLGIEPSKLMQSVGWNPIWGCSGGTDEYGFSAIPAGYYDGTLFNSSQATYFWSAKQLETEGVYGNSESAYTFILTTRPASVSDTYGCKSTYATSAKDIARSVRCVKD